MTLTNEKWEWGDIGFDTKRKLWFAALFNETGKVEWHYAKNIVLDHISSIQYQWPHPGKNSWHVRERIFAENVKQIDYDEKGNLVIKFLPIFVHKESVPANYSYISYAFSLHTSKGFIDFYDENHKLVTTLSNKWIIVEDLKRRTIGEFPNIRLRVEKKDVKEIIITQTTAIIIGNTPKDN
jgi:hypothetical protein